MGGDAAHRTALRSVRRDDAPKRVVWNMCLLFCIIHMLLLQEASYSLSHVEPINHEENWRLNWYCRLFFSHIWSSPNLQSCLSFSSVSKPTGHLMKCKVLCSPVNLPTNWSWSGQGLDRTEQDTLVLIDSLLVELFSYIPQILAVMSDPPKQSTCAVK